MPVGPGKYDEFATKVRTETQAMGVVLIVLGGSAGNGFAVQAVQPLDPPVLAELLETVAERMRRDSQGEDEPAGDGPGG